VRILPLCSARCGQPHPTVITETLRAVQLIGHHLKFWPIGVLDQSSTPPPPRVDPTNPGLRWEDGCFTFEGGKPFIAGCQLRWLFPFVDPGLCLPSCKHVQPKRHHDHEKTRCSAVCTHTTHTAPLSDFPRGICPARQCTRRRPAHRPSPVPPGGYIYIPHDRHWSLNGPVHSCGNTQPLVLRSALSKPYSRLTQGLPLVTFQVVDGDVLTGAGGSQGQLTTAMHMVTAHWIS